MSIENIVSTTRMNPERKAEWIAALRSGKYTQLRRALHKPNEGHCCLAVLCDLVDPKGWQQFNGDLYFVMREEPYIEEDEYGEPEPSGEYTSEDALPEKLREKLGISASAERHLIEMNDGQAECKGAITQMAIEGKSFAEIADWIEANL